MQFLQFYGIDWLATICGLAGVYMLGNKSKIGFALMMVASLSWVTFGFLTGSVAVCIGSAIFLMLHFRGLIKWNRESKDLIERTIG